MLTRAVLDRLSDQSTAGPYKARRIYESLDQAAAIFCRLTKIYKRSVTLTTVALQQDYTLPPDFLDLWMENYGGRRFVRYYDGTNHSWPTVIDWKSLFRLNLTVSQDTPSRVSIRETESIFAASVTGTATTAGAAVRGLAILTDSTKTFLTTTRVWPRDVIHNETDGSYGRVIEVTDATHLKCALFEGNINGFGNGNAYTIVPESRMQLTLEAPPVSSGHLILMPYVGLPDPVFADYSSWRISDTRCRSIACGAAALLQLPDNSWEEARVMNGQFLEEVKRTNYEIGKMTLKHERRPAGSGW